jgi:hypothetical protein
MGRIVVDGFSRHGGDLVVILSAKDADIGRLSSNASGE